jgi:nitrite reductase/ring-hydroxylating ferredoxin subunit
MNLPQYSDLLIPGVYKETPPEIGVQGIIIYNFNGTYKAFDMACPHLAVNSCSKMTFDGALWLKCPCDEEKFSIYDGSARSGSISNLAREYHVQVLGTNQLHITNY